jgi:hypothetical protein
MKDEEMQQATYYFLLKTSRRVLAPLVMNVRFEDPVPRLLGQDKTATTEENSVVEDSPREAPCRAC